MTSVSAQSAFANPTGATVVNGSATFSQPNSSTLAITNSPGAIINWQQFNIGANEVTRFIQQNASSAVLNRVTGLSPSEIFGALNSNGRVFLVNGNGIVFGPNATINTSGFIASTLN
ncbi:MAG: filamentous hemagglutinin N-terminal domain-containing protein, partial [Gammaproteobacteria bacterium]